MSECWRIGPKRGDWLRSVRCFLTGHRWELNRPGTQKVCRRCWTAWDLPRPKPCTGCIAPIDCDDTVSGCHYPEPHRHGFDCDKTCSRCQGRGIPISDPENHPNHREWGRSA